MIINPINGIQQDSEPLYLLYFSDTRFANPHYQSIRPKNIIDFIPKKASDLSIQNGNSQFYHEMVDEDISFKKLVPLSGSQSQNNFHLNPETTNGITNGTTNDALTYGSTNDATAPNGLTDGNAAYSSARSAKTNGYSSTSSYNCCDDRRSRRSSW